MISNETVLSYSDVFQTPPGVVLGYRANGKPIYNIAGGSVDVTDDDVTDSDDNDSDDTDDSDSSEDDWVPPSREDWQKILDAKKKADSEAAQRKRWLRDNGFDPKTGKPIAKPSVDLSDDDDDLDVNPKTKKKDDADAEDLLRASREKLEKTFQRQLERETAKAETRGRSTAYNLISEVPAALEEAGWNGKNLPRMIKLLDLDSVEIDEDGVDAEALSNQVAELKKDFPEFFKRTRMKDAAKEIADTGTVGGGKKKAPASEEDLDWKARMKLQLQRPNH
jgi:hypothetical protein